MSEERRPRPSFRLRYEIDVVLHTDDLWPDGDAPQEPTVENVEALIVAHGGWDRVVNDWSLNLDAAETSVTLVGQRGGRVAR